MELKNKDGFTSAYGFACGITESRETDSVSLQLYREHGVYNVKHLNYAYERTNWNDNPNYQWNSFEKLSEAKNNFFDLCNKLNFKRIK